jgi:amidohydrolase
MSTLQTAADLLSPKLTAIRRELHQHPELSHEEFETTARLRTWLTDANITILPYDLKTGLVAEVRGALPGPIVALRTDIDALPVSEETGLPYASLVPGKMHACWHDFHMTTILGATLLLQERAHELAGTVRILFQPAEESSGGATSLIEAGALNGVSSVFGLHNQPGLPAGYVGIKVGPLMAAVDAITITVHGKGGHAAIPDATVDPIVAGSAIVMALQTAVSRVISPLDPVVVSIGSFQAGTTSNVIPPTATMLGTVRTYSPAVRQRIPEILGRIVTDVAAGYGARAVLNVIPRIPAVSNDAAMCEVMRTAATHLGMTVVEASPTMGGEDFSEYQQVVPGCFIWLGTGCKEQWHHPAFQVDDSVLPKGAALFAQVAIEALARG